MIAWTTPREPQTRMGTVPIFAALILILCDDAKEAVCFVSNSGREKDSALPEGEDPTDHQIGVAFHRRA